MALDPTIVALDSPRPVLRALDGGRKADRRTAADMAQVEVLAFFDEVETAAARIVDAVTGLMVPSAFAINEAARLAHRARAAREELLSLTSPDGAA